MGHQVKFHFDVLHQHQSIEKGDFVPRQNKLTTIKIIRKAMLWPDFIAEESEKPETLIK